MSSLSNKQIILGVSGGIAAYKSAELTRRLRQAGAEVRVVMTDAAKEFITPLTLQAVSGNPVYDNVFDLEAEAAMGHIELGRWADLVLIAPATANAMAAIAHGQANDLLTTLCLATAAKIAIAPAMNQQMWADAATQANLKLLHYRGIISLGPDTGAQACGDVGYGRMLNPDDIIIAVKSLFKAGKLTGTNILITAGPTQEAIDPIRYLTNHSTGKMGYALAEAAVDAGASVTLISGPTQLEKPERVTCINVVSAHAMNDAVQACLQNNHIFIAAAAVADYQCESVKKQKLTKMDNKLRLDFIRTPDILTNAVERAPHIFHVGFAAETHNILTNACAKLTKKNIDMIIANDVSNPEIGFSSDNNAVTAIWHTGRKEFALMSKKNLARHIIALIAEHYHDEEQ